MNLPPTQPLSTQPPPWGQTPEFIERYIVACRSSALVLNRQGCLQEARELRDLADQAEQDLAPSHDGVLDPDVLGRSGTAYPPR